MAEEKTTITKTKTEKKPVKSKTVSITEFRAWLEGIEEMGGRNWAPTAPQWKKIRAKIRLITESTNRAQLQPYPQDVVPEKPRTQLAPPAPLPPPPASSALTTDTINNVPAPPIAKDSSQSVKTPVIDTSDGVYKSSFI